MIGSELGYNAGQLGNDWEDDVNMFFMSFSEEKGKLIANRLEGIAGVAIGDKGDQL